MLPFSEYLLINRGFWLSIGLGLLAFCYYKFSFSFANAGIKLFRRKSTAEAIGAFVPSERLNLPKVSQSFSFNLSLKQYFKLSKLEFNGIIKSVYFIAIVTAGIIFLFVSGAREKPGAPPETPGAPRVGKTLAGKLAS